MQNKGDIRRTNEMFTFKEIIVLLPVICLSSLRGIGSYIDQVRFTAHLENGKFSEGIVVYSIIHILGVVPGMLLVGFLLEIFGRKPVFILLFILSLLSSILSYIPYQYAWGPLPMTATFIVAILKGGVFTTIPLAMCEYGRPKHRFAYIVASEVGRIVGGQASDILYGQKVLSTDSSYVSLCEGLVAAGCLVCVYWWPESPYWLAGQGRRGEAHAAVLQLRGEGGAAREEAAALGSSSRRPTPKLFWWALLVGLLAMTIAKCSAAEQQILQFESRPRQLSHRIIIICVKVAILFVYVLISYKIQRRLLYFATTILPLALVYIFFIWMFFLKADQTSEAFYISTLVCSSLLECCFYITFALYIEFVPQKYYTYLACICSIYFYALSLYIPVVNINYREYFPMHASLFLLATTSFVALVLLVWLSQETRNKNLKEIEKEYLRRLYPHNPEPEQVQVMLENVSKL